MRSLIILEVEHGETLDPLTTAVGIIASGAVSGVELKDWTVKVDLPACFVLDVDMPSRAGIFKAAAATYNPASSSRTDYVEVDR